MNKIDTITMLPTGTELRNGPLSYRIERPLSSGGFGNTYVASQFDAFGRKLRVIALKEFFMRGVTERIGDTQTIRVSNRDNIKQFEEQKAKLLKEAQRLSIMNSPYIVKVIDLFEANGTVYYAMEFIDGKSVEEIIKESGKLPEAQVRHFLPQMLHALNEVHNQGFQHLDIKPANIMIRNEGGDAVLIDFGASKQLNADGSAATSTGLAFTAGYAPREQMEQNLEKFGPWTDLYALGATLYRALTSRKPPMPSDIEEDREEALKFDDDVSPDMRKLIFWLMTPRRSDRPQKVEDVQDYVRVKRLDDANAIAVGNEEIPEVVDDAQEAEAAEAILPSGDDKETQLVAGVMRNASVVNNQPGNEEEDYEEEEEEEKKKFNYIPILLVAVALIAGCIVWVWLRSDGGANAGTAEVSSASVAATDSVATIVTDVKMSNKVLLNYTYTGPVDENNLPHGKGKAVFSDGRSYEGNFNHGTFEGKDAHFKYSNGDSFVGEFKNNYFFEGKYTIGATGEYYIGTYDKGAPANGKWYDKNGKML